MKKIVIKGRGLVKGVAEGEALVIKTCVKFFHIDPSTGTIFKKGHESEGKSISHKILVFPSGCGETADSNIVFEMAKGGTGPLGIINLKAEPILMAGVIMGGIPYIDRPDKNPMDYIETGDYVKMDARQGIIEVIKK